MTDWEWNMDLKTKGKTYYYDWRCRSSCQRLGISEELFRVLLDRIQMPGAEELLSLIQKSKTKEEWKSSVIQYMKQKKHSILGQYFLLGTITGTYSFVSLDGIDTNSFDFDHFKESLTEKAYTNLREHFYDYVLENNGRKNSFLWKETGYDYTMDLEKERCLTVFDAVFSGKNSFEDGAWTQMGTIARNYIVSIVGIYGYDMIESHFDFILYDLEDFSSRNLPLEERKKDYLEKGTLSDSQLQKRQSLGKLKERLEKIDNEEAKTLLRRLEPLLEAKDDSQEIEDSFLEYQVLFREDILNHLYLPKEEKTFVEDFRDLKPQLLHLFFRNPEKHRTALEEQIKEEILAERKKSSSSEWTEEEEKEFEKRKNLLEAQLDPLQVNYSFDNFGQYTDSSGLLSYHSDTDNQISATIFSEAYFLKGNAAWYLGVGFNREGVVPEAIALSSSHYITTNKGLNNLTYQDEDFSMLEAPYSELVSNDGKSEVVLFRRNLDYDTKGSYLFLSIDSSDVKKSQEYLEKATAMAETNHFKLVVYDLYKIKKSYEAWINQKEEVEEMKEEISSSHRK